MHRVITLVDGQMFYNEHYRLVYRGGYSEIQAWWQRADVAAEDVVGQERREEARARWQRQPIGCFPPSEVIFSVIVFRGVVVSPVTHITDCKEVKICTRVVASSPASGWFLKMVPHYLVPINLLEDISRCLIKWLQMPLRLLFWSYRWPMNYIQRVSEDFGVLLNFTRRCTWDTWVFDTSLLPDGAKILGA